MFLANLADLENDNLIIYTSEVTTAAKELDAKVSDLNAFAPTSGATALQWDQFRKDWAAWFADNVTNSWFLFDPWARRDELLMFRRRFNQFYGQFGSGSGVTPYTATETTKNNKPSFMDEYGTYVKLGGALAVLVAGGYALGKVTNLATLFKKVV